MGTFLNDTVSVNGSLCQIDHFYSSLSWIEGKAIEQLEQVACLQGVKRIAAFPDLHPGKYGPVGCAILSSKLYPHLIGNDVGCGMTLFALDIPAHKLRLDKIETALRQIFADPCGEEIEYCSDRLEAIGLSRDLYPQMLGSIGGGNHFFELQQISEFVDPTLSYDAGLGREFVYLLVHSGSRTFGNDIFSSFQAGQDLSEDEIARYLSLHDQALSWAFLNRQIVAERVAKALRTRCRVIADAPHNCVEEILDEGGKVMFLHRKGAAKADMAFVPVAGSRDSLSYLLHPVGAIEMSLGSIAHGAGRKYNRRAMHGRISPENGKDSGVGKRLGGRVICDDKEAFVEEAPQAYKDVDRVVCDLEKKNLVSVVASLRPLVTFKNVSTTEKRKTLKKNGKANYRGKLRRVAI